MVACRAEQFPDAVAAGFLARAAVVIMVNREGLAVGISSTTDSTATALRNQHGVVLIQTDAVFKLELPVSLTLHAPIFQPVNMVLALRKPALVHPVVAANAQLSTLVVAGG
jgi:hypothetical protein